MSSAKKPDNDISIHVGILLKNLPNLHESEYKVGYHLHENTFFQKCAQKEILDKGVRISPVDYFKGLVLLSHYCGIIEDDYQICDNLLMISKAIREAEKKKDEDKGASFVALDIVVEEVGLRAYETCIKMKDENYYTNPAVVEKVRDRYERRIGRVNFGNAGDPDAAGSPRRIDPYYMAMGQLMCDMMSTERRFLLDKVSSRGELEAVIYTDCLMNSLQDGNYRIRVEEGLGKNDYLMASLIATEGLSKEASESRMKTLMIGV